MTLLSPGGQVLGTATTDANGNYTFPVTAGEHTVEVDSSNFDLGGALESTTSTTGDSLTFTVVDDNILDYDFGYLSQGSIGDYVWRDVNGDGVQDVGEPGMEGVTVTLEADLDGDGTIDLTQTTVTGANGLYLFDHLPPGSYTVTVDATTLPADIASQTFDLDGVLDNATTVDLALAEDRTDVDFGFVNVTYTIGDTVFCDADGDGVQGSGEHGVADVRVSLLNSTGQVVATATTDANGSYSFSVPAGEHTVVVDSTNFEAGGALEGTTAITGNSLTFLVVNQGILDYDFGYCRPIRVVDNFDSGTFSGSTGPDDWAGPWIENDPKSGGAGPAAGQVRMVDYDYLRLDDYPDTGGEPSAAREVDLSCTGSATLRFGFDTSRGVDASDAVTVEISADGGVSWTTLEVITGITGATWQDRNFDISAFISERTQVRFRVSNKYGGSDEFFYVGEFEISASCDAAPKGSIAGTIWDDGNGDGMQQDSTAGLADVKVRLHQDGQVLGFTVTDGDGHYSFPEREAGSYVVHVDTTSLPDGIDVPTYDFDGIATSDQAVVLLAAGQDRGDVNFGYQAAGGVACGGCDHYRGSLSGAGDRDIQPDGTYYYSAAGTHQGWLEGPSNADFDLALYKWNGSGWSRVAFPGTWSSSEHISYHGRAGYYLWTVDSYSGGGNYELGLDHP